MKATLIHTACWSAVVLVTHQLAAGPLFTGTFPSDSSTVIASVGIIAPGEYGYFWSVSRGDSISQTFAGTGLAAVEELALSFPITENYLNGGAEVDWNVSVNGTDVGTWAWHDSDSTGTFSHTYQFPTIAAAGDYTVAMNVVNEVPGGLGSIAIGAGQMTLTGVPEPAAYTGLVALGLLGFVGLRRIRRS